VKTNAHRVTTKETQDTQGEDEGEINTTRYGTAISKRRSRVKG